MDDFFELLLCNSGFSLCCLVVGLFTTFSLGVTSASILSIKMRGLMLDCSCLCGSCLNLAIFSLLVSSAKLSWKPVDSFIAILCAGDT